MLLSLQDSVYYHPTLNPTGAPPPGKPPMFQSSIGMDSSGNPQPPVLCINVTSLSLSYSLLEYELQGREFLYLQLHLVGLHHPLRMVLWLKLYPFLVTMASVMALFYLNLCLYLLLLHCRPTLQLPTQVSHCHHLHLLLLDPCLLKSRLLITLYFPLLHLHLVSVEATGRTINLHFLINHLPRIPHR